MKRRAAASAAVAPVFVPAVSAGTQSREPVLILRGTETVTALGSPRIIQAPGNQTYTLGELRFPSNARQGPDAWYLIHLNIRVTFGLAGSRGDVERPQSRFSVRVASVDIVDGARTQVVRSRTVRFRYRNYLRYSGVTPGQTALTVKVRTLGDARIARLTVLPGSGIERTSVSPARVIMRLVNVDSSFPVNEPFDLDFELRNVGDRLATGVVLHVDPLTPGLKLLSPRAVQLPDVAQDALRRPVRLIAHRAGTYRLEAFASTSANRPGVAVEIRVGVRSTGSRPIAVIGVALVVAVMGAAFVWMKRRDRRGG